MRFQEPKIEYVCIHSSQIHTESTDPGSGGEVCMQWMYSGGNDLDANKTCAGMTHSTGLDQNTLCEKYKEDLEDSDFNFATVDKIVEPALNSTNAVSKPSSVEAPVRSAPHFNNDLFK